MRQNLRAIRAIRLDAPPLVLPRGAVGVGWCDPVGREKVNWPKGPREAGLGRDLGVRIMDGAPSGRALQSPKAPSEEGAVSRQADWGRDTSGHTGPPLQDPRKCNVERRRGQAPPLR